MTFNPPHGIIYPKKVENMLKTLKEGKTLPPVVTIGEHALTGSHRLAAWLAYGIDADYIEITEKEYVETMEKLELDPIYDSVYDYREFCEKLSEITNDSLIKEALQDQF